MKHRGKPATVSRTRCVAGPAIMASTGCFLRVARAAARHGFDSFAWTPAGAEARVRADLTDTQE
jgi:hypothetical protein